MVRGFSYGDVLGALGVEVDVVVDFGCGFGTWWLWGFYGGCRFELFDRVGFGLGWILGFIVLMFWRWLWGGRWGGIW